jgi:hypothetical protein
MKEPEFSNPKRYSGINTRWLAWHKKQKENDKNNTCKRSSLSRNSSTR